MTEERGRHGLRAGAASRDITPRLGGDMFGYVRPDLRVRGVAMRLHAHALVLDDGDRTVCLLTVDLGAPLIAEEVLGRVRHLGYDASNLIVAATHTHAGPNRPGAFVADQAAEAVVAAHRARRPATAGWAQVRLTDANRSRSLEAHLANHGLDLYPGTATPDLDPDGADHARDVDLRLLRVQDASGRPLAAWAHFSAHPTTYGPANTVFSADYPGAATRHFRRAFEGPAPVAIVTNGTEGDLIPRYDDVNQQACADRMGRRVAEAMQRAWEAASPRGDLRVEGRMRRIAYAGQQIAPGRRVGTRPWFGLPFVGGAQNGPSFLYGLGLEGRRRPRGLAGPVHGRKLLAVPAPHPRDADVTVLRIGDRLLLSVPGEPTVEAGRRMRAAALEAAGSSTTDAFVIGLAQSYLGYFTTPEEYDQQHYEGGHTLFGRYTSLLVERTHARLAAGADDPGADGEGTGRPGTATRWSTPRRGDGPVVTPRRARRSVGPRIVTQPPPRIERFGTLAVAWRAARRGGERPVDAPYLVVERWVEDGWVPVDDDLGTGCEWRQRGRLVTARYEVAGDLPLGRHRIVVHTARGVTATRTFEVVAATALLVRDATHRDGVLQLRAQNPPPDPQVALRSRATEPVGGRCRVLVGGHALEAGWDPTCGRWTVPLGSAPAEVEVPAGGLVDDLGNRSGPAVTLRIGVPRSLDWPASIGPGGGRAPGLFGRGLLGPPIPGVRASPR